MTDDRYEYFVIPNYDRVHDSPERFDGLWRRADEVWEYFSLFDRHWHREGTADHLVPLVAGEPIPGPNAPSDRPEWRVPVDADRAAALTGDFHQFTRFWGGGEGSRPTRVYRQVSSPESGVRGFFGRSGRWSDSSVTLNDFLRNGPHDRESLVELDARDAEEIIQETRGVDGATEWWPRVDPDTVRFVVSGTFVVQSRECTLVTGRLERGVVRPPTTIWWKTAYKGIGSIMVSVNLPLRAVEFPLPAARERGEITLVLDHPGIELEPGTMLYTSQYVSTPGTSAG